MGAATNDRTLEDRIAAGRSQNALLAALALLFVPALVGLYVNGDYRIGAMIGLATAVIPALLLRDRLSGNRKLALAVTPALAALGAYVNAFEIWVAVLGAICGFAAAWVFFMIKDNANYRPNLLGEKK
ncbi:MULTISPECIES: hypothetical protein [Bacteria]|uniref:hypothetical protein n=1 Tax=Bacteria TaxID=2 RepID=UPI000C8B596D|nr:hypothetical protein [Mycolicibacterium poriferae]MAZ16057.1 hypothetical protein [Ahrensia sp.]|tara:strand:+ start:33650 stop:34033 length:384 start_codon:yes stop_codon:yes gene_type:complete